MKKKLFTCLLLIISVLCLTVCFSACDDKEGAPDNSKSQTISVTSVTLDNTALNLSVGDSYQLTATVSPSNATNKNVVWTSSNNSVVTVSGGTLTVVSAGIAVISATTEDGNHSATCTVSVNVVNTKNILLLESNSGEAEDVITTIESGNYNVTVFTTSDKTTTFRQSSTVTEIQEFPNTLDELANYSQVIFVNIAYSDLPTGFEEILYTYVYDLGGGLLTIGGENEVTVRAIPCRTRIIRAIYLIRPTSAICCPLTLLTVTHQLCL